MKWRHRRYTLSFWTTTDWAPGLVSLSTAVSFIAWVHWAGLAFGRRKKHYGATGHKNDFSWIYKKPNWSMTLWLYWSQIRHNRYQLMNQDFDTIWHWTVLSIFFQGNTQHVKYCPGVRISSRCVSEAKKSVVDQRSNQPGHASENVKCNHRQKKDFSECDESQDVAGLKLNLRETLIEYYIMVRVSFERIANLRWIWGNGWQTKRMALQRRPQALMYMKMRAVRQKVRSVQELVIWAMMRKWRSVKTRGNAQSLPASCWPKSLYWAELCNEKMDKSAKWKNYVG